MSATISSTRVSLANFDNKYIQEQWPWLKESRVTKGSDPSDLRKVLIMSPNEFLIPTEVLTEGAKNSE